MAWAKLLRRRALAELSDASTSKVDIVESTPSDRAAAPAGELKRTILVLMIEE
jgi:hypothetical protein